MKIEEAECNDDLSDLTDKQIMTLQDWVSVAAAEHILDYIPDWAYVCEEAANLVLDCR
jgi:hypothetical protein